MNTYFLLQITLVCSIIPLILVLWIPDVVIVVALLHIPIGLSWIQLFLRLKLLLLPRKIILVHILRVLLLLLLLSLRLHLSLVVQIVVIE